MNCIALRCINTKIAARTSCSQHHCTSPNLLPCHNNRHIRKGTRYGFTHKTWQIQPSNTKSTTCYFFHCQTQQQPPEDEPRKRTTPLYQLLVYSPIWISWRVSSNQWNYYTISTVTANFGPTQRRLGDLWWTKMHLFFASQQQQQQ